MKPTGSSEDLGLPFRWQVRILEDDDSGCWLWIGAYTARSGYGATSYEGRQINAHRAVYQFVNGPVPDRTPIDHLCRVRICVNPAHLEAVSQRENILRGDNPRLTKERHARVVACPKGHTYTEENTAYSNARGWRVRYCKTCKRIKSRERRSRGV